MPLRLVPWVAGLLSAAAVACSPLAARQSRVIEAGFWFDHVTFDSNRLGGPLTDADTRRIETVARAELAAAFQGLWITFSERQDARYRVRVMQELLDLRFRRPVGVAGQSRAVPGFGGSGAVSFVFVASGAVAYAPAGASRVSMVEAIGRGVGRTAVHEFTHQLLPKVPIHDSRDPESYEFASAARPAQYYGRIRWDLAWPLLRNRLGG
jgi:hypothetical protein